MISILIRDTEVKITDVLKLLGEGYTYDQISNKFKITPTDIILSARIASDIISEMVSIISSKFQRSVSSFLFFISTVNVIVKKLDEYIQVIGE